MNYQQLELRIEELELRIEELFNYGDLADYIDLYSLTHSEGFESFRDGVEKLIDQAEIIYYSKAMEYLMQNDVSLSNSLALAGELGYSLADDNLNSEILATLLLQKELREEFAEIEDDIEELFEKLEEEEDLFNELENAGVTPDDIIISSRDNLYIVGSEDHGYIGDYEEMEEALESVKNWKKENNYFPTIWFVSDHGNMDIIDDEGNIIE